jgi:hypothetical protein
LQAEVLPFLPRHRFPNDAQDRWTTRALTEVLWKTEVPKFLLLWLSEPRAGTFTFAQAMIETADAPDLLVACRWNSQPNEFKVQGEIASDIGHSAGQGRHATPSPFDMRLTTIGHMTYFDEGNGKQLARKP